MSHASVELPIEAHGKNVAVDVYKDGVARLRVLPLDKTNFYSVDDVLVAKEIEDSALEVKRENSESIEVSYQQKRLIVRVQENALEVRFIAPQGETAVMTIPIGGDAAPHATVTFPLASHLYGIPERAVDLVLRPQTRYRLYNLDVYQYKLDDPGGLYGTIPFLLAHGVGGSTGLLMLNSADSAVTLREGASGAPVTVDWEALVGPVDFFFLPGPTPMAVQRQHAQLTGTVFLPPMFSLGYHQCRWNYRSSNDCLDVNQGFETHGIPYDVLWLDIEHTEGKKYFTWDKHNFPNPKALIDEIASYGRKMVTIVDPHIKREAGYYVHDEATSRGFYVKRPDGSDFEGHCWPGTSSWVDYYNEHARSWYASLFSFDRYEGSTPALFTWIDMNEPSVFNAHEVTMDIEAVHTSASGKKVAHKYLHNMYGFYNSMAVHQGLLERSAVVAATPEKAARPFILTRSFFAGSQRYAAAWTGDNMANWGHLRKSLSMLLTLGLSNFPFAGADVGGFFLEPDAALMTRWYQVGIFYPFFRGHAHLETKRREPWLFDGETTRRIRDAIAQRYALLPYLYTLFWNAHEKGEMILRPMFVEFPTDASVFDESDTFCLGPSLAASPVVTEGETTHTVRLPARVGWFHFETGERVAGETTMAVTMDSVPMFLRAGRIVPLRERLRRSTAGMAKDPLTLIVAPNDLRRAMGEVHIDDGESMAFQHGEWAQLDVALSDGILRGTASRGTEGYRSHIEIERIVVFGVTHAPTAVVRKEADGVVPLTFEVKEGNRLVVRKPGVQVDSDWIIEIKNS